MTLDEVWIAVRRLSEAWASTQAIVELNKYGDASEGASPIGKMLQNLNSGFSPISSQPLALATNVRMGLSMERSQDLGVPPQELHEFLELAGVVEAAHREMVAWVRSRLPGYPLIGVPQLAPGTSLTTNEFSFKYSWSREDFAAMYQYTDSFSRLDRLLGTPPQLRLSPLVADFVGALRRTREWRDFASSGAALDPQAKAALRSARTELKERVSASRVDSHEPRRAMRRADFRVHETKSVVEQMDGPAGKYARDFQAIDDLIDLSLVRVFAQMVRSGTPPLIDCVDLEFDCTGDGSVTWDVKDDPLAIHVQPGNIIRVNHVLVKDLVWVHSTSNAFSDSHERTRLKGRLLRDSAAMF